MSLVLIDRRRAEKQFRQRLQASFPAPKATPDEMLAALKAIETSLVRRDANAKGGGATR